MSRQSRLEIPRVFISSTSEDLKKYREAARDAALGAKFHPDMMESFTVSGARTPLVECQAKVAEADVTVIIVAHRYGWVPVDQQQSDHKNICWLECEAAIQAGQEVLAFVVDDNFPWPAESREEHQLVTAVREGKATAEQLETVQRSVSRLRDFKTWLNGRGIRALFTTPEDLRGKVSDALREWRSRQPGFGTSQLGRTQSALEDETFALQQLIIDEHARTFVGRVPAQSEFERFRQRNARGYFILVGEPGQGKTALCSHLVKAHGLVHHFVRRGTGRADERLIAGSLIAQLAQRTSIEVPMPGALPDRVRGLENLVASAVGALGSVVIAIDALDELPDESARNPAFLITEGLPHGAFYLVTCRPGVRCDSLVATLKQFSVPHETYALERLDDTETRDLLHQRNPRLSHSQVMRIAAAAEGNPLYVTSVIEALAHDPAFDLQSLPPALEGIFQNALEKLTGDESLIVRQILGILMVARRPFSLSEISEITREKKRRIDESGLTPIRHFLHDWHSGFTFYHSRFREFLLDRFFYEDEVPEFHRLVADWLCGEPGGRNEYRWSSLAHHLFSARDEKRLLKQIDATFLREKTKRCGYDVLEDIELVCRVMLDADDPEMVPRSAALVEDLQNWLGGDLIREARRAIEGQPSIRESEPQPALIPIANVPGIDVCAATIPKFDVGADFVEVTPRDHDLLVAVGDAPGVGLRGAFVARFVANLFARLVRDRRQMPLTQILEHIDRRISSHPYFERIAMQCAAIDPQAGILTIANAGGAHAVLYSARRRTCERLIVRGPCLFDGLENLEPPRREQRRVEFDAGDILVLVTDGITEGHRFEESRYGYRFIPVIERSSHLTSREIVDAVLADWAAHPRDDGYRDDVTIVVLASRGLS